MRINSQARARPVTGSTPALAEPTNPVVMAIVRRVVELTMADKAPTHKISRMGSHGELKRGIFDL